MSGLLCVDCDDDAEPGFLRCEKHTQEFDARQAAAGLLVPRVVTVNIKAMESVARLRKLAEDVRQLRACSLPPDWRPFVSELADELAAAIAELATKDVPHE